MGVLIFNEIALQGGHLFFAKQRRQLTFPAIPNQVSRQIITHFLVLGRLPNMILKEIQQFLACIMGLIENERLKFSWRLQRYAAVKKQVMVVNLIHRALVHQKTHMLSHLKRTLEWGQHTVYSLIFFWCQSRRIFRIDSLEASINQGMLSIVNRNTFFPIINLVQHNMVLHLELRPSFDELIFQLELDNC